jgi:hypothetical protein
MYGTPYSLIRYGYGTESLNIRTVLSFIFMLILSFVVVVAAAAVVDVLFKVLVLVLGSLLLHFKGLLGLLLYFMHDCYSMVRCGAVGTTY